MESPLSVQDDGSSVKAKGRSGYEQSFSTTLDLGDQPVRRGADSVAALDSGAAAKLVRFRWTGNRNLLVG